MVRGGGRAGWLPFIAMTIPATMVMMPMNDAGSELTTLADDQDHEPDRAGNDGGRVVRFGDQIDERFPHPPIMSRCYSDALMMTSQAMATPMMGALPVA